MREKIINILQAIELEKKYTQLCQEYCDFEDRANLTRKEVEPIIKFYDPAYKYIARDRTFMKEFLFEELTVRFFIGYKSGITDFGYLIWKEGENHNYQKGDLAMLTEMINPNFHENLTFKRPIVSSLEEFEIVISKFFELYYDFKDRFEKIV
jgi:hypothetical protein